MIIIAEKLIYPYDEGSTKATLRIIEQIKKRNTCTIFSINGKGESDLIDFYYKTNKLLLAPNFLKKVQCYNGNILYIPSSTITLASFIRAKILNIITKKAISIISLQPVKYNFIEKEMIKLLKPKYVICQSIKTTESLKKISIKSKAIPLGVNATKFSEFSPKRKNALREKYAISKDKLVILHVGHLKKTRNIDWVINIKENVPKTEIIIIASTSTEQDENLYNTLLKNKIKVFREYIPNIEDFYNIADLYFFPVTKFDNAIETPLSVLEAMACNIPVISTRFGSLPDVFNQDQCFRYISSISEVVDLLKNTKLIKCNNRSKVLKFSWENVAGDIIKLMG